MFKCLSTLKTGDVVAKKYTKYFHIFSKCFLPKTQLKTLILAFKLRF